MPLKLTKPKKNPFFDPNWKYVKQSQHFLLQRRRHRKKSSKHEFKNFRIILLCNHFEAAAASTKGSTY